MNLTKAELESLLHNKTQETKHQADRIKENLLSYLADLPGKIHRNGPEAIGEFALQVGNLLVWLTGTIEPGAPPVEYGLDERAKSIHGLGKQFREIGLKLFNENSIRERQSVSKLRMDFEILQARLSVLEASEGKQVAA